MTTNPLFDTYKTTLGGHTCYFAGLPGYPRNFSRDTLIAGIIATDSGLIESQITVSTIYQGEVDNSLTGEELGKIHHEYPGVVVNQPYISTYNACDSTALYIIGLEFLAHLNKAAYDISKEKYIASIEKALTYLNKHIKDDIFWEYPPRGARHFSLYSTYWKDSIVPNSNDKKEPDYPVAFGLVQFQVARALLAASRLLGRQDLANKADRMFRVGITTFINSQGFCVEQDETSRLEQSSSDELHALAYIPLIYQDQLPFKAITARAKLLTTPIGIACTPQEISAHLSDTYHGYVVWIFEQALIHYGCSKFGLSNIAEVTLGCAEYIDKGNELLSVLPSVKSIGNSQQLWSVAAKIYFSDQPSLRQTNWL